jgi:hypothetical protein
LRGFEDCEPFSGPHPQIHQVATSLHPYILKSLNSSLN